MADRARKLLPERIRAFGGGSFARTAVVCLFVAAAAFTVISTVLSNPGNALLGGAIIAAGIPFYLSWRYRGPGGAARP